MKKLIIGFTSIFALMALLAFGAETGAPRAWSQFSITNLHNVATNIVSTNLQVMRVTLIGLRAEGQSNSAAIYVGTSTNAQPYIIGPGERHIIEAAPNTHFRLNDWWFKTTVNDGITVIYQ